MKTERTDEMRLHLVIGSTGEYSDRSEWPVRAFKSKAGAEDFIKTLEAEYRKFEGENCGYQRPDQEGKSLDDAMKKLDPKFEEDYTGTMWHLDFVEYEN